MCENTSESSYIDVIGGEVKIGACADSRGGDGDNGRRSDAMQCNTMQRNATQRNAMQCNTEEIRMEGGAN